MKAIVTLNNLVVDADKLHLLDEFLKHVEVRDSQYDNGNYTYVVQPFNINNTSIKMMPEDMYETEKLVYKLQQEAKKK